MKRLVLGGLAAICLAISVVFLSIGAGEAPAPGEPTQTGQKPARPAKWAVPLKKPGLPNLHKVNKNLYRGAQPTAEGMRELKKMGVKTVVNLRSFHSDRDEIGDTGLGYEHLYVKAWHAEDEELVRFLQIVTDKKRMPVFFHCKHGADRTGMMAAVYRIAVEGWTKDEALKEMKEGGFGWHKIWKNLADHIRELDVEALKKKAGLVKEDKPAEPAGAAQSTPLSKEESRVGWAFSPRVNCSERSGPERGLKPTLPG